MKLHDKSLQQAYIYERPRSFCCLYFIYNKTCETVSLSLSLFFCTFIIFIRTVRSWSEYSFPKQSAPSPPLLHPSPPPFLPGPPNNSEAEKEKCPSRQHSQPAVRRTRTAIPNAPHGAIICGRCRPEKRTGARSADASSRRCIQRRSLWCVQTEESRCFSSRCGFAPPPAAASVSASHLSTCVTRSRGASKPTEGLLVYTYYAV